MNYNNIVPVCFENCFHSIKQIFRFYENLFLFRNEKIRFLKYFSKQNCKKKEQIKARLLFYGHSLEKGMSRENIRFGFGVKVIKLLLFYLERYTSYNYDENDEVFKNACSIVNEYIKLHKTVKYNLDFIDSKYNGLLEKIKDINNVGGVVTIDNRKNAYSFNFRDLVFSRKSVRDFAESEVEYDLIVDSVELAIKSPSVCNRQGTKIYVVKNKVKIKKALDIQGGFNGYRIPPCLLLITEDIQTFIDVTERNQGYIDGGLFSMSLLYALEHNNLAACALNTMFNERKTIKTKELLNIPENENLIMYVAVGNFKEHYNVPLSVRKRKESVMKFIN